MKKHIMTAAYSVAHFFVDMACAFIIFRSVYDGRGEILLYYNFCAFALQMPLGVLFDRYGRGHLGAAAGCALIGAAYPFMSLMGANIMAAVMLGVGNALFHLGGGVYVLDEYKSSGALGVFVSPGAVGLYLGTVWGKGTKVLPAVMMWVMFIWGAALFLLPKVLRLEDTAGSPAKFTESPGKMPKGAVTALVMFTAVVVLRSFGGFTVSLPWKAALQGAALAAVAATALGKAAGGYASDIFGKKAAAAVSMGLAAVLYIFSGNIIAGLFAVFLFNMTMPITLRAAADIMKGGRGFSFGLLTFGLFLGYIPLYLNGGLRISGFAMAGLCALSGILLLWGFKKAGEEV
ncbi:MAG: hypothetical protein NC078_02820 [Ruminococcus sp.]|nr:hypothetical protein [Ruminococcus sp.]